MARRSKPERGRGKRRILDYDLEIGRRLRVFRIDRGLGQAELGDAIDVSFQQIQKYELGLNRISAGKLIQIAAALNMPLAQFFEGLEEKNGVARASAATTAYQEIQAFAATADGRRLYRIFLQIEKPETRRRFLRLLESFTGDQDA